MKKSPFLQTGLKAVKVAEKIITEYFNTSLVIDSKHDGSPVTIADKEAEAIIRQIITNAFPTHGFIGEEYGSSNRTHEYTWVIDPIDGTKNYSRGIPLFATELALFKRDELILGISNAPMQKKLLHAEKGTGAYLNETTKLSVSTISKVSDAYISVGSVKYFSKTEKYNKLAEINEACSAMKGFGDTWSYHFIAEGKLDAILEAKTNIWDVAAMAVIIEEAGGTVTDLEGNPLSTTSASALATNGLLHSQLLTLLQ